MVAQSLQFPGAQSHGTATAAALAAEGLQDAVRVESTFADIRARLAKSSRCLGTTGRVAGHWTTPAA